MKNLFLFFILLFVQQAVFAQVYGLENDTIQTPMGVTIDFEPRLNDSSASLSFPLCDYPFFTGAYTTAQGGSWGQWTPNGDSLWYTPPAGFSGSDFFYYAICNQNGNQLDTAQVVITVVPNQPPPFPTDSVWPGDANYDGIANNLDLLPIGLFYGQVGFARPNANLSWTPQACYSWYDTLSNGANIKHIDTDGDSLILDADTLAIVQNYGLQHNKGIDSKIGPLLYLTFSSDTILAGDTAEVMIHVGQDTAQVSLYGIAFSIAYDTSLIDPNSIEVSYQNSWLGSKGTNMLTLAQNFPNDAQLDMALTRKDLNNQLGYGELARFKIIMVDDLTAKADLSEVLTLTPFNIFAVTKDGAEQPIAAGEGTVIVFQEEQNNTALQPDWFQEVKVYPNPTNGTVHVDLGTLRAEQLSLYDLSGKRVQQQPKPLARTQLDLTGLSNGVYLLRIQTEKGWFQQKVVIQQ